jgi:signal transduction histidine kinase
MTNSGVGWRRHLAGLVADPGLDADEVRRAGRSPRDWVVDVAFFLLAAGFTTLVVVDGRDPDPVPLALDATLGGLCCLGVWLRRRWPVGFAITAIVLSVVSTAAGWVSFLALFTVAVHRRLVVVGLLTAGATVACISSVLVRLETSIQWWQAALSVVVFATVAAWGMFIRVRRELAQTQREHERRARHDQLEQARRQERLRIAREMHDVLAHRISLVSLHAGALGLRPDRPADEVARAAEVIRDSAHQALEELRAVIGVLRADPADDPAGWDDRDEWPDDAPQRPQPTLADLPELADESRLAGARVELTCRVADPAAVPVSVGRSAYRIVQEGLTNARKHAHGADVSVTVDGSRRDGLTVEIRNPLPPEAAHATVVPGAGSGIVGLAERASLAGGRLEHGRTPAGDFRLRAWLPWPP